MQETKMIQIGIKMNPPLKALCGTSHSSLSVPSDSSVRDALKQWILPFENSLYQRYGFNDIQSFLDCFIILRNGAHLSREDQSDTKAQEGDLIEIMEVIAGG
jgi:sulfur carrier protein ThiS